MLHSVRAGDEVIFSPRLNDVMAGDAPARERVRRLMDEKNEKRMCPGDVCTVAEVMIVYGQPFVFIEGPHRQISIHTSHLDSVGAVRKVA